MANRQPGYIDGRRIRVGNIPNWGDVPGVLIPGTLEAYGIFEDFASLEQLAVGGSSMGWDFWIQNAAVLTQADAAGGHALITCGGADEDSGQIVLGSLAGGGIFFPAADKHIWFEARIYAGVVAAAEFNYFVGLVDPVNAALLADGGGGGAMPNNNCIGIWSYDGETDWYSIGDDSGVESSVGLGEAVTAAWITLGFYVNGITSVQCYINRVATGAIIAPANLPDGLGLMPAIAAKNGSAAADTIQVDYIMCVQLR